MTIRRKTFNGYDPLRSRFSEASARIVKRLGKASFTLDALRLMKRAALPITDTVFDKNCNPIRITDLRFSKGTRYGCVLSNNRGVILLELLIVVMILGLLVAGAVKTWDTVITQTRFTKTAQEMQELVDAIVGNAELYSEGRRTDFGYVGDMGVIPESLGNLVHKPSGASDTCWRGPYIKVKFAENPNDYLQDAWGNNYIYNKESLFIRSYTSGNHLTPQTWINKSIAKSDSSLLINSVSGYVKDLVGNPPVHQNQYLRVYITYPLNGTIWTPMGFIPSENGFYIIPDIPQGNHRMICLYDTTLLNPSDTTDFAEKYACVYPGIQNTIDFKLSVKF